MAKFLPNSVSSIYNLISEHSHSKYINIYRHLTSREHRKWKLIFFVLMELAELKELPWAATGFPHVSKSLFFLVQEVVAGFRRLLLLIFAWFSDLSRYRGDKKGEKKEHQQRHIIFLHGFF